MSFFARLVRAKSVSTEGGLPRNASTETDVSKLRRDGYLVLRSVLTQEDLMEVKTLLDPLFMRFHRQQPLGLQESKAVANDEALFAHRELTRTVRLDPRLKRTAAFTKCRSLAMQLTGRSASYIFDHAIYKYQGKDAATEWHQDQSYLGAGIDLRSLHFWIPLQTVDRVNGCMSYVPGSHLHGFVKHKRKGNIDMGYTYEAQKRSTGGVACPMDAGDISVHHPLTLHFAYANSTPEIRRAWILHFGPYGLWAYLFPRNTFGKLRQLAHR